MHVSRIEHFPILRHNASGSEPGPEAASTTTPYRGFGIAVAKSPSHEQLPVKASNFRNGRVAQWPDPGATRHRSRLGKSGRESARKAEVRIDACFGPADWRITSQVIHSDTNIKRVIWIASERQ